MDVNLFSSDEIGNDKSIVPIIANAKKLYTSIKGDVGPLYDTLRFSI